MCFPKPLPVSFRVDGDLENELKIEKVHLPFIFKNLPIRKVFPMSEVIPFSQKLRLLL